MTTWITLLRAVNVGGHGKVGMNDLRAWLAELGYANVRSVLQSGNLVLEATAKAAALERRLETESATRFGLETEFFARSAAEWREVIAGNPFAAEARTDPSRVHLFVLKAAPSPARVRALESRISGRERLAAGDRHLYLVYPDGMGRSRFTTGLIEKALGTRGTARNWNTVLKLGKLVEQSGEIRRDESG